MQKYKPRTPLASVSDRVLRVMITCGLGIGWFVYLWGMRLTALTAGVAFGGLLWLCARQFGKKSMLRREKQMRRIIGGELALGRLLLMPPRHAAFQAALWIAPRVPVQMQRALEWGVTGMLEDRPVLVRLIAQHESVPVTVQQVVEAAREMRAAEAKSLILCLTAPATREALAYASGFDPPIRAIERQEMIDLAGLCSPATDEDLSRLGKKKGPLPSEGLGRPGAGALARKALFLVRHGHERPGIAYGQRFYPIPAAICLLLFAACKLRSLRAAHQG